MLCRVDSRCRFSGSQPPSPVRVSFGNAAHSHILVAEHPGPGSPVAGEICFITDHDTGNFFESMDPFLEQPGIRRPMVSIPHGVANTVARLVQKFSKTSNFNRFSVYSTCVDCAFVHAKATRDFGYRARFSREEAFDITLEWLKMQKSQGPGYQHGSRQALLTPADNAVIFLIRNNYFPG